MTDSSNTHYAGQDLEALADLPRYTGWILEQFQDELRGHVIEVGAGIGNVAIRYVDRVESLLLVEPAANLCEKLRIRTVGLKNVVIAEALLHDVAPELVAKPFDAALMVNVLEHIPDDVAVLTRLYEVLKPGGALCIFVPAVPEIYGSLDAIVDHVRRYRRAELQGKLEQAGFVVKRLSYLDTLGIVPWVVAGKILKRKKYDALGAQAYDRVGVPVTRALEAALNRVLPRTPIGKSLVAVAVKPG